MDTYFSLLEERNFTGADEYRRKSIPERLIKFYSLSDSQESDEKRLRRDEEKLQTLEEKKMWFSSVDLLNDPYEFSCMCVDRERLKRAGYPDELINGFEDLMGPTMRNFGVASLSGKSFDCLPMWAYYANNYAGFCVEYEVISKDAIYEVSYEPSRIPLASILGNFFHEFEKMKKAGETSNPEVEFYATLIFSQLFMKHQSWSHEKEYRILFPICNRKGVAVSLSSLGLTTKKIVAGINCTEEHVQALQRISDKLGCGRVETVQISPTEYTLL